MKGPTASGQNQNYLYSYADINDVQQNVDVGCAGACQQEKAAWKVFATRKVL